MKNLTIFFAALLIGFILPLSTVASNFSVFDNSFSTYKADKKVKASANNPGEVIYLVPVSNASNDETVGHDLAPWVWTDKTFQILEDYAPFIFRTKKSAAIDEVRVILKINDFGKLIGFEVLNEDADKGLIDRLGYVLRKLPPAQPVPGFSNYSPMEFELVLGF